MSFEQRCELTVTGQLAGSVIETLRSRFTVASIRAADSTVVTVDGVDQAAVRAVMILLWDTGHEVLTMTTSPSGDVRGLLR
jgi:hypothetical protein